MTVYGAMHIGKDILQFKFQGVEVEQRLRVGYQGSYSASNSISQL